MLSLLKTVLGGLGGIGKLWGTVAGDKVQQEANIHDEQSAAYDAFAKEMSATRPSSPFNNLIDGLNRLPRPAFAFGVIALFMWPVFDPIQFSIAAQAWSLMPEWLSYMLMQIVLLYFGGRILEKVPVFSGPSIKKVRDVIAMKKEILSIGKAETLEDASEEAGLPADYIEGVATDEEIDQIADGMKESEFRANLLDDSKPMSLPAIFEWNKRRKAGKD